MTCPRKTIHTHADGSIGATIVTRDDTDLKHQQEVVVRRLRNELEDQGFTTHLDVIRAGHDHDTAPGLSGYTEHYYTFPPRETHAGHPARVDGGPAHRGTFSIQYEGQTEAQLDVNILGSIRTVTVYLYGFDTATGEWVFTDAMWMAP